MAVAQPEQLRQIVMDIGVVDRSKTLMDEMFDRVAVWLARKAQGQVRRTALGMGTDGQRKQGTPMCVAHGNPQGTFRWGVSAANLKAI